MVKSIRRHTGTKAGNNSPDRGRSAKAEKKTGTRKSAKTRAKRTTDGTESNGNGNGNGDNYCNGKVRCKSLVIDGTKYRTRLNYKFENRKTWESPNPKKVTSSIPGTVIKVFVKEGQEVKEGDQMLILEAMKMKNNILFHQEGKVKSIHVKEGEKVPKNFLMLEMD